MSDTPETDIFNGRWATERINGETIFGIAQRLERERNKSAECAEALNDIADLLDMPTGATPSEIVGKARSRWATKTKPMKYCDMCAIPSICSELHKCRYAKAQELGPLDKETCSQCHRLALRVAHLSEALEAADECLALIEDVGHGAHMDNVTVARGIITKAMSLDPANVQAHPVRRKGQPDTTQSL